MRERERGREREGERGRERESKSESESESERERERERKQEDGRKVKETASEKKETFVKRTGGFCLRAPINTIHNNIN